ARTRGAGGGGGAPAPGALLRAQLAPAGVAAAGIGTGALGAVAGAAGMATGGFLIGSRILRLGPGCGRAELSPGRVIVSGPLTLRTHATSGEKNGEQEHPPQAQRGLCGKSSIG